MSSNYPNSWNWSFGDGSYSSSQNPIKTYSSPGLYNVTLNATNTVGAGGSSVLTYYWAVTISQAPNTYVNNRTLYLPFTGSAGASGIIDYSAANNSVFNTGTATINTSRSKFGGSSLWFNNAYNSVVLIPDNDSLEFKAGDFYVGWWENTTTTVEGMTRLVNRRLTTVGAVERDGYFIGYQNAINPRLYVASVTAWDLVAGATMGDVTCKTWDYYVVTRNGTSMQTWKNGVLQTNNAISTTTFNNTGNTIWFGGYPASPASPNVAVPFNGFVDDLVFYNKHINGSIVPTSELLTNPAASFTVSNASGILPVIVNFTDTSTGDSITAWNWSFGNGDYSTARYPTYTYRSPANYTIRLTVTGAFGTNTSSIKYVNVSANPVIPDFSANPTFGSKPALISFTNLSTNLTGGQAWLFGDENWSPAIWTRINASSGWLARYGHTAVALPDGSIVLAGGSALNDTWRSTNNGSTWTRMNASSGWSGRTGQTMVSLSDGSIILMGGLTAVFTNDTWRSTDNGATWTLMNASSGWQARQWANSIALSDNSIVTFGGYNGVVFYNDTWRSTDNGVTWTRMNASSGWQPRLAATSVALPDNTIVTVGGTGAFLFNDTWKSSDNGATWTLMNSSSGMLLSHVGSGAAMFDGSMIALFGTNSAGTLVTNETWRTADKGATWTRINASSGWAARWHTVSVAMPDGSMIMMGGYGSGPTVYNDTWKFNPIGSVAQNPSHTYVNIGNYSVSLQVYNFTTEQLNSTRKTGYINISDIPIASFIQNATRGYPITTVIEFNDTSSSTPTSWKWNFTDVSGNNTPVTFSTSKNTTWTFGIGNYKINLTVTNTYGSNTTTYWNSWVNITDPYSYTNGSYYVIKFNSSGSVNWTPPAGVTTVDYLVVAGGGSGGNAMAGGGGGGGMLDGFNYSVTPGTNYTIVVGDGARRLFVL